MPRISELEPLTRPVLPSDYLLIEAGDDCYRLPASSFQGEQGIPGTQTGIRQTVELTTPSLATGASHNGTVELAKTFELLGIACSQGARVRLYSTPEQRDADAGRTVAVAPTPGLGLIVEINNAAATAQALNPHAHGASMEPEPTPAIAYRITNNGPAGAVTLAFHFIPKEQ